MKSSYSAHQGACVDVSLCACGGLCPAPIVVTSTTRDGAVAYSRDEWLAFLAGAKAGEFDLDEIPMGGYYASGETPPVKLARSANRT
jgi:hypothetical protein